MAGTRRWRRSSPGLGALAAVPSLAAEAPRGLLDWLVLLWPFPAVITSTFLIAWASEVAAFFISRGLALAVLATLQVLPEFAVEAVLAHNAALDPSQLQFVTANFTGANRILVGLALPLIFLLTLRHQKRSGAWDGHLALSEENSVEVVFLLLPSLYSLVFWFTEAISLLDTAVLLGLYATYIAVLYRMPTAGEEDVEALHGVPARVMGQGRRVQGGFAAGAFLVGGFILLDTVEPFVHNMQVIALALGISAYLVVQYIAPLLSEFPEFLSTTYFARRGKGEDAFTNVVSAKIGQWTLLIGMIPLVFVVTSLTHGVEVASLPLDRQQNVEVLLTSAQGLFAVACLLKLRFLRWEAATLFGLWAFQAVDFLWDPLFHQVWPTLLGTTEVTRVLVTFAFFALIGLEAALHARDWVAFAAFRRVVRRHVLRREAGGAPSRPAETGPGP